MTLYKTVSANTYNIITAEESRNGACFVFCDTTANPAIFVVALDKNSETLLAVGIDDFTCSEDLYALFEQKFPSSEERQFNFFCYGNSGLDGAAWQIARDLLDVYECPPALWTLNNNGAEENPSFVFNPVTKLVMQANFVAPEATESVAGEELGDFNVCCYCDE